MITLRLSQLSLSDAESRRLAELAVLLVSDSLSRNSDAPRDKTPSRKDEISALLRAAIECHGMATDDKRRSFHFRSADNVLMECKMTMVAGGTSKVSLYALRGELNVEAAAETAQSFYAPSVRVNDVPSLEEFVELAREYMQLSSAAKDEVKDDAPTERQEVNPALAEAKGIFKELSATHGEGADKVAIIIDRELLPDGRDSAVTLFISRTTTGSYWRLSPIVPHKEKTLKKSA